MGSSGRQTTVRHILDVIVRTGFGDSGILPWELQQDIIADDLLEFGDLYIILSCPWPKRYGGRLLSLWTQQLHIPELKSVIAEVFNPDDSVNLLQNPKPWILNPKALKPKPETLNHCKFQKESLGLSGMRSRPDAALPATARHGLGFRF